MSWDYSKLTPGVNIALVMDEVTKHIQDEIPWCMLFSNNIVLIEKTIHKKNLCSNYGGIF